MQRFVQASFVKTSFPERDTLRPARYHQLQTRHAVKQEQSYRKEYSATGAIANRQSLLLVIRRYPKRRWK